MRDVHDARGKVGRRAPGVRVRGKHAIRLGRRVTLCALSALIAVSGCGGVSEPPTTTFAGITVTSVPDGNNQIGAVGATLAKPIAVKVERDGAPAAGIRVRWTTTFGNGQPTESLSDANGVASTTWTLGASTDTGAAAPSATGAVVGAPTRSATLFASVAHRLSLSVQTGSSVLRATVGHSIPQPLRVMVTESGRPVAGVTIKWYGVQLSGPLTSVSGADGIASMSWTLPTLATTYRAFAAVSGDEIVSADFAAVAQPDVPDSLAVAQGNNQEAPANASAFAPLTVNVYDRYGNPVPDALVLWGVESGPAVLEASGVVSNALGRATVTARPSGVVGDASVVASVGAHRVAFTLRASEPAWRILLNTNTQPQFISLQNYSAPAVDTVPVGATVIWTLSPFDYDDHWLDVYNSPVNSVTVFPYAFPSTVRLTFTTPGVYHYRDAVFSIEGTLLVVRK